MLATSISTVYNVSMSAFLKSKTSSRMPHEQYLNINYSNSFSFFHISKYLSFNFETDVIWLVGNFSCPVVVFIIEPRCEKTGLRGFRPGPTQTGLCNH